MAALFALLTALVAATLLASDLLTDPTPTPRLARQAGQLLYGAAGAGILAATLWGLIVGAKFGIPPGPHIRWCLLATVPVAATAALIAALAPRQPALAGRDWAARLHQPVIPILLAGLGMFTAQASLNIPPPFPLPPGYQLLAGHLGAGLLAVAIILTITDRAWPRLIGGLIAFLAAAIFFDHFNLRTLGQGYILAVTAWWISNAARITTDALTTHRRTQTNTPR